MQYLSDNPRILFVLLTLIFSTSMILLVALAYWLVGRFKAFLTSAATLPARGNLSPARARVPQEKTRAARPEPAAAGRPAALAAAKGRKNLLVPANPAHNAASQALNSFLEATHAEPRLWI